MLPFYIKHTGWGEPMGLIFLKHGEPVFQPVRYEDFERMGARVSCEFEKPGPAIMGGEYFSIDFLIEFGPVMEIRPDPMHVRTLLDKMAKTDVGQ